MHTRTTHMWMRLVAVAAGAVMIAGACSSDDGAEDSEGTDTAAAVDEAQLQAAVDTYAEGVHAAYAASLESAMVMDEAIDTFVADPTQENLDVARQAWLDAREDYGPTEAFRFYGGPIDDEETGTEGLINAWPLDEAYIDYVEGDPGAGIINDPDSYPEITEDLLVSLNEEGGEANISTGWHAIEFLLWGQDLSTDGAGARPVEDYTTAENAERRGTYLTVASDLLVSHLEGLEQAWAEGEDNYRAEFVDQDPQESMVSVITGIGELSRGELAGERMNVAYTERSQEDEHSCFSDNTTRDIVGNAKGIQMVLLAEYPGGVSGTSVLEVIAAADADLAAQLESEVAASVEATEAIPAPFDQHLAEGVSDDDPGRASILTAMEALEAQTDTIVAGADAIGVTINVS